MVGDVQDGLGGLEAVRQYSAEPMVGYQPLFIEF